MNNDTSSKDPSPRPEYIPGIYNYCDRWCERCPFTARCENYAYSEEKFDDPASRDPKNLEFWNRLTEVFQDSVKILEESAAELGIDLDTVGEATMEERDRFLRQSRTHDLALAAAAYSESASRWFEGAEALLETKEGELNSQLLLGLPGTDPHADAIRIKDAVEIVQWYQDLIQMKLVRALGRYDVEDDSETGGEFPKDSDGSAKVALMAVERSIAAWGALRKHFPDEGDVILDLLVRLDRLLRRTEEEFPEARGFVRPGFDEPGE